VRAWPVPPLPHDEILRIRREERSTSFPVSQARAIQFLEFRDWEAAAIDVARKLKFVPSEPIRYSRVSSKEERLCIVLIGDFSSDPRSLPESVKEEARQMMDDYGELRLVSGRQSLTISGQVLALS
jgi:hypothetical protein